MRYFYLLFVLISIMSCGENEMDNISSTLILPIPPRLQWENGHGYCGETSIQAIALYHGVWISQQIVRNVAGGELLVGINSDKALETLKFDFESWDWNNEPTPQYKTFMPWMKKHLQNKTPIVFATFLADDEDSPDYDHIEPAIGIKINDIRKEGFDPEDELIFYNDFDKKQIKRPFKDLHSSREGCKSDLDDGGCIPNDYDYGVAIKGILDKQKITKPVQLVVSHWDEPNVSEGKAPRQMNALVIVSDLLKGQKYSLLRFEDYNKVPTEGTCSHFLTSEYVLRVDFIATDVQWYYNDPVPFSSDGVLYYRVVCLED